MRIVCVCLILAFCSHEAVAQAQDDTDNVSPPTESPTVEADAEAPSPESDAETAADDDDESSSSPILDFLYTPPLGYLFQGGIFMWPILLMGVIGAGVIIERYRSLKMLSTDSSAVREQVQSMLEANQAQAAFDLCNREQGPVPAVLATGLRKFLVLERLGYDPAKVEQQVVKAMDDYSVHIVAALERHLPAFLLLWQPFRWLSI